ncbi:hypothetical protein N9444_11060, partial [Gammaproteobacteria bacterium]|nr:hypothetical protein [Gammaproteobacteria bacterium]
EATIRITSPSPGQEIEKGEAFDISWEATGAARDMDICLEFIRPNGDYSLGWVHPSDEPRTSTIRFRKNGPMPEGEWTVLVSALFEGGRCSATVDNFCSECDNPRSEIKFTIKAPEALCGNGIVEGDEVCDYGVLNNEPDWYRCGPTMGISRRYLNDDGVGSPYSHKATACIMQCASILDGPYNPWGGESSWYYHWAYARNHSWGGSTVYEEGVKTCTPE